MELQLAPCGAEAVGPILAPMMIVLKQPGTDNLDTKQIAAYYEGLRSEYEKHLKSLPADLLSAACDAHVAASSFFPTPHELLALTDEELAKRRRYQRRIEQLIKGGGRPQAPAFVADPPHVRLLTKIKWHEKPGSFLFSAAKADVAKRELQALVNAELDAASAEGREPAEWTVGLENVAATIIVEASATMATEAPPPTPKPERNSPVTDVVALVSEEDCPGHVASESDAKVCGRCGIHIDSLRPPDDDPPYGEEPAAPNYIGDSEF